MDRVAIVGGGPAGYVAAITAAHRGKQVTLIEQKKLSLHHFLWYTHNSRNKVSEIRY
ncbi:FAD-dependent oxidoreductase [Halalkalibacterium halodurans]|nr:FAD-dependent oxidoreductase [Halalkalibacterium halodurans]